MMAAEMQVKVNLGYSLAIFALDLFQRLTITNAAMNYVLDTSTTRPEAV
jgi:hypothetical protein